MSTLTATVNRPALGDVASDIWQVTRRNLVMYTRVPQLLVFSTIQPIMFVLLFNYVFGGAIGGGALPPGLDYTDFLLPGVFAQSVIFGATATGIGLAEDLQKGIIDRYRSLPMARSAVLAGRTFADMVRNVLVVILMAGVGFLIGFDIHAGWPAFVGSILIGALLGYAFSWVQAWIGLQVKQVEAVQAASFVWVFPLVFASSAFVPTDSMPGWLQAFAEHTPVTAAVNAMRALTIGGPTASHVWATIAWVVGILAVAIPLSVRTYRKAA